MQPTDIGAHITGRFGGAVSATAAGSGDNTEVDGAWIDRQDKFSCKLIVGMRKLRKFYTVVREMLVA